MTWSSRKIVYAFLVSLVEGPPIFLEHDVLEHVLVILWDGHPLPLKLLSRGAGALARAPAITRHFDTAKPVNTAFYLSTTTTTKELTLC